jgi:hypothetical protein
MEPRWTLFKKYFWRRHHFLLSIPVRRLASWSPMYFEGIMTQVCDFIAATFRYLLLLHRKVQIGFPNTVKEGRSQVAWKDAENVSTSATMRNEHQGWECHGSRSRPPRNHLQIEGRWEGARYTRQPTPWHRRISKRPLTTSQAERKTYYWLSFACSQWLRS